MRVAVVGAGAMGSLVAYALSASGAEVTLYESCRERLASLAEKGLRLCGVLEVESRLEARHPSEGGAPFDLFVLAVRGGETGDALRPLSPFVHRDTFYLSLQEGDAWKELAGLVGGERTCAALAWVSAAVEEDGAVVVEGCRSLVVGSADPGGGGPGAEGLAPLVDALRGGFPGEVEVARDLREATFRRLRSAAPVSALCALGGVVPRHLRAREEAGTWLEEAAGECASLAASMGLELPPLKDPWGDAVWDGLPPPMLHDLKGGRVTERDYLTGYLLREAAGQGMRIPVLTAMHSLLGELEGGERVCGEGMFRELRRRISEERGMSLM